MCVAGRRLVVGVPKQPSDHGQGFLAHRRMAGEGMAQIVYAQFAKISPFKNRSPEMPDAADRPAIVVVPEQPPNLRIAWQAVDDFARRRAEPDCARAGLAVAQQQAIEQPLPYRPS